jgi:hypothetical protein
MPTECGADEREKEPLGATFTSSVIARSSFSHASGSIASPRVSGAVARRNTSRAAAARPSTMNATPSTMRTMPRTTTARR